MPLTIKQMHDGIRFWRTKKTWPQDFHNEFYEYELAPLRRSTRAGVFNQQWWDQIFPILQRWQATRPSKPEILTARAQARFTALSQSWAESVMPYLASDIAELEWHQIAAFPLVVREIKVLTVPSPTFTAKFCHFLAPRIFPVVDKDAVGNPDQSYKAYFERARAEWLGTDSPTQTALIASLTNEVQKQGRPIFGGYPTKCKAIELCLIGRHHSS